MARQGDWLIRVTAGEALGIAGVSVAYAAVDRGHVDWAAAAILVAGAWEGLCLGSAQASVLARAGVRAVRWIGLTVAGAVLGYGLSLLAGAGGGNRGDAPDPPVWLILILGAGLGLATGAVLGALQGLADPGRIDRWRWMLRTALGWAPGMAAILYAASHVGADWSLAGVALAGAAAGAVAGLCVALATAGALPEGAAPTPG
jgi:uncharacterized membrane protein YfcA